MPYILAKKTNKCRILLNKFSMIKCVAIYTDKKMIVTIINKYYNIYGKGKVYLFSF